MHQTALVPPKKRNSIKTGIASGLRGTAFKQKTPITERERQIATLSKGEREVLERREALNGEQMTDTQMAKQIAKDLGKKSHMWVLKTIKKLMKMELVEENPIKHVGSYDDELLRFIETTRDQLMGEGANDRQIAKHICRRYNRIRKSPEALYRKILEMVRKRHFQPNENSPMQRSYRLMELIETYRPEYIKNGLSDMQVAKEMEKQLKEVTRFKAQTIYRRIKTMVEHGEIPENLNNRRRK